MDERVLTAADSDIAIELWRDAGLTRPWIDPVADFHRALAVDQAVMIGIFDQGTLAGTVMVGDDGHRGWVYYLAVGDRFQRHGVGAALMTAAETWLRGRGVDKAEPHGPALEHGGARLLRATRLPRRRGHRPVAPHRGHALEQAGSW